MVSSVASERLEAADAPAFEPSGGPPRPAEPGNRRRTLGLPALTLLVGLLVTLALVLVSQSQYTSNENRLLRLRVSDAGAILTTALPGLQSNLASAAELADATNGNVAKFDRFVSPSLGGASPQFRSISLWQVHHLRSGPLTVVGTAPRLAVSASEASAFLARTSANGKLGVIGQLGPPEPRLGYAYAAGRFIVYAETELPPARHARIQKRSAFTGLNDALFLGSTRRPQDLLTTNVAHLPLPGPTASVTVPFGDNSLTLVMSSRVALAGSLPKNLPWIIAVLGALLTAAATLMTLRLTQRRRAAEELAQRLEVSATENRRLYAEQRTIAQTLQHALLPDVLPQGPQLQASARYVAGELGVDVGGDWYDVIELDERRLLLVVGDVSGRGLHAATTMAALRYAIRAYAAQGDAPPAILTKLSRLVSVADTGQLTTILCVLVDTEQRTISVTSAGHLPPLLIDGGVSRYVEGELGLPIGVESGAAYDARRIPLPETGTIVAFTDGLVERRGESIDEGLERARTEAAGDEVELPELLDRLVAAVPGGRGEDDIAILGVRWRT
ncbi:MAG TPA: PP2C family protein-serine/threonine phosphatase [Solirubrobacteraceae bacterium]|jgi:serine phosphatase RsbU (regulator of sigma subunit)|nr:PP2C family protein-serine/threonine phosphatase [Solirubrobacteraceae bacterium]